jgi:hypothetical protein
MMHHPCRVTLLSLAGVALACSSGKPGGVPAPAATSNVWVATPWADTSGAPTSSAHRGDHEWIYATLRSLTIDTTKDSTAHAMFQLRLDCDGCLFHFRESQAVDDGGERWDVSDMPPAPHPGPDGFGWVAGQGSRQLYIVYSAPMAGRPHRATTLTVIIRVATGFRGLVRDPMYHPGRVDPGWFQDLTFEPAPLNWASAAGRH